MPFQKLLKKVDHPQNFTKEETSGAHSFIPEKQAKRGAGPPPSDIIEIYEDAIAAPKRIIFEGDPDFGLPEIDAENEREHRGEPHIDPSSEHLEPSFIRKQLTSAMEHIQNKVYSARKVKQRDLKPERETPFNQGLKSVLSTFSAEDMTSFGDIISSEGYFWLSKAIEAAFATPQQYVFIINSVMIRYANQIFMRDGPFSKFSTMITTAFEKLVAVIGGFFLAADIPECSKHQSPYEYEEQGGLDAAAGFFTRFSTQLSHLLKYMSQQNVLIDLVRIIAIALLGSFTFIFGDRESFSWENVETMVKRAMRLCTEGTIGSFTRVLTAMYGMFSDFLTGGKTSDFSEFLKSNTQQNAMAELCVSMKARIAGWGGLTVDQQSGVMEDWIIFEAYCNDVLGRTRGWASGKRLLDSKALAAFQSNYYTIQVWAQSINMGALRKQPMCIAFIGPSSMGKTTVMDYINQMILGHLGVTDFAAGTFNVSAEGDHMDGATNGKKTFVLDDVGTKLPTLTSSTGGDQQLAILVRLLNNIPYFPVMAALEDKGVVCCTPSLVLISSNLPTLGIEHSYVNPTIVERRVKYWVTLSVRPEFRTPTGILDSALMKAWSINNPGKVADAWEFTVTVKSAAVAADGKMFTFNEELETMSTPAFLKFVMDEFKDHDSVQDNVLAQANSKYDFSHVVEHGDSIVDPTLKTDYEKPKYNSRGGKTYSSLLKRPSATLRKRGRGSPSGIHQQSGEEYSETFHSYDRRSFGDYSWRGLHDVCITGPIAQAAWMPIFGAFGFVVGYLSSLDWTTTITATQTAISDVNRMIELAGYATGRYSRAMAWVKSGIEAMSKLAKMIAPFIAAATAAVGVYYFTKMVSAKKDEIINQGGHSTKRKSPDVDKPPSAEDMLLLANIHIPPLPYDISHVPGHTKVSKTSVTSPPINSDQIVLPQRTIFNGPQAPSGKVIARDNGGKPAMIGEWLPHPNDKVTSYADGMPDYKAGNSYKIPINMLSQQSLSIKGHDLVGFVHGNMVDLVFRSAPYNELGFAGTLVGAESMSTMVYKGKGLFYQGRSFITSEHYIPEYHPERHNNPIWAKNWTLTLVGASDTGGDVILTQSEVMAREGHCQIPYKDCVKIHAPKARSRKTITPYFARRTLPSNALDGKLVDLAKKNIPPISDARMAVVIGANQYLPTSMPVGLCTDSGISPAGLISETTVDTVERRGWLIHTKAWMDVPTYQGQCGTPVLTADGGLWKAIVGIHTGVMRINDKVKVFTPVCQEDLHEDYPMLRKGGGYVDPIQVPAGANLQDAVDIRYNVIDDPRWNGPQVDAKMNVQFLPPVHPTKWEQSNLDWVTSQTGYVPNPDSYSVLGARDGKSGNLASEYKDSPVREAFANADWTGLPAPLITDKCVPNINRRKRNQAAAQNLGQIMAQMSYNHTLAEEFMEAADSYLDSVIRFDDNKAITSQLFPYTMQVAINGHRMENGNISKATTPLNYNTSAGLPFAELAPVSNKIPWFIVDAEGNRHMGEDLSIAFEALKTMMADAVENGPQPKVIFKVALKDEVLSEAKLEAGKIRFILVCPVHATLLTRQMLLCLCRTMALNPFVFGACVGVDATSAQWKQLYDFLTEHGGQTFDGDYQGFDKGLIEEITSAVKYVVMSLLRRSGNYDAESLTIVSNLLSALLAPVVDVFGILYFFRSLNSSGNPLTTQINCIANMLLIWLAFLRRVKKNTGDRFDIHWARDLFKSVIRAITYGDDNVISSRLPTLFSCSIMAEELKDIIRYTDAQKGDVTRDFTPAEDLVFLGRKMCGAPRLEFKRIIKMLTHYRKYRGVDFSSVIGPVYRNVLMETYFHGREVFLALHKVIVRVLSDYLNIPGELVIQIYLSSGSDPLSYEFFDEWYQSKASSDALIDPRFEDAKVSSVDDAAACDWYAYASGGFAEY